MEYNTLLDIAAELGYQLAMSGAETFRVEESINRVLDAYGIKAEVFAIPNCLHVSIETDESIPMTRMRRIGYHGNDLDAVEKFNDLSRRICVKRPAPAIAMQWLDEVKSSLKHYGLLFHLIGNYIGAFGFGILFGGNLIDGLCAGLCGVVIGLAGKLMDHLKANQFFRIISVSFLMALLAYTTSALQISTHIDAVIIGALMILVPGLLFTNALRDIIYEDTNSGMNRIVQVFLIAIAIALGTGAALNVATRFYVQEVITPAYHALPFEALVCFIGCIGFIILFNIHGAGGFLCAFGGVLTWVTHRILINLGIGDIMAYFFATTVAALYSESMARIRKCSAISYLLISCFPLIPGAGVYYTMNHAVRGDMSAFVAQGTHTISVAGAMAVGILLVSTVFRFVSLRTQQSKK